MLIGYRFIAALFETFSSRGLALFSSFSVMRFRNLMASPPPPSSATTTRTTRTTTKKKSAVRPLPLLRFAVICSTFLSLFFVAFFLKRARQHRRHQNRTVAYSLWFEPPFDDDDDESSLSSRAKKFIAEENAKNDVAFEPHVTLLGPIYHDSADESELVAKTARMVREIQREEEGHKNKRRRRFGEIRFPKGAQIGTTYFQCVYLEAEVTMNLIRAREKAIETFDVRDARRYVPHMSLVYGDYSRSERVRLTTKADEVFRKAFSLFNTDEENEDENFTGEAFEATSVSLWKTDVEDKSCKSWRKIKEFPL